MRFKKLLPLLLCSALLVSACSNIALFPGSESGKATVLFSDRFDTSTGWRQSVSARRSYISESSGYEISTNDPATWWFAACPYTAHHSFDVPYAVELRGKVLAADGTKNAAFGIVFNYLDSRSFDWLALNATGQFQMGSVSEKGASIVEGWTANGAIKTGKALNDIKLYQYPDRLVVEVNGVKIAETSRITLPDRPLEVMVMADNYDSMNSNGMTALFRSFVISELE